MSIENLKKILESEREELQDLFTKFDSDRNVEFIEKYPMLWSDVYDIMEESRYHRAMINSVLAGHNSATNRLLPLLQKAVEMAEFYGDRNNWGWTDWNQSIISYIDFEQRPSTESMTFYPFGLGGKKAREFLSELTKMTEIKKEGL